MRRRRALSQFMYNQPHRAKKLYFDVIPRAVDEYVANVERARGEDPEAQKANPVWHFHGGVVPDSAGSPIPFNMLLNLASVVNADTPRYPMGIHPALHSGRLGGHAAISGTAGDARDRVLPRHRPADEALPRGRRDRTRGAGGSGGKRCAAWSRRRTRKPSQTAVYEVGKRHPFKALKDWFGCLYQVLLGQQEGPRFGGFVALYGVQETVLLIETALTTRQAESAA